jgi:predicted RNA-binding Zn-ribbon protein involved in translation (DUF1610 family)
MRRRMTSEPETSSVAYDTCPVCHLGGEIVTTFVTYRCDMCGTQWPIRRATSSSAIYSAARTEDYQRMLATGWL